MIFWGSYSNAFRQDFIEVSNQPAPRYIEDNMLKTFGSFGLILLAFRICSIEFLNLSKQKYFKIVNY